MSNEPFDEVDRALAHGLSQLAPDVEAGDGALAELRPRFRRARTRTRAVRVGATIVALVAIGSAAVLAAPGSGHTKVSVSSPSTAAGTHSTTTSTRSTTTTTKPTGHPSSSTLPEGWGGPPTTASSGPGGQTNPGGGPGPTVPVSVPVSVPGGHGGPGGGGGHGGGPGPGTTTTVPADSRLYTYASPGGSITIRFSHGHLDLVSETPAHGYTVQVAGHRSDEIDVRFDADSDHGQWRIRVQVDHNGHLTHEIDHS